MRGWSLVGSRPITSMMGASRRHLDADEHTPGQRNPPTIERRPLTLRIRLKRLTRKTICLAQSIQMHDIVIGLCVKRNERLSETVLAKRAALFDSWRISHSQRSDSDLR